MKIIFRALNKNGQAKKNGGDVSLFTAFGNGQKIPRIDDLGNGTYSFDYQCIPGINTIDVKCRDISLKGFPLNFKRKTESDTNQERAQEDSKNVREEENRTKEEERIKEEANKAFESGIKGQEARRKQREDEYLKAKEERKQALEKKTCCWI